MAGKPVKRPNPRKMARLDLNYILNYYHILDKDAFAIARVHRITWKRWLSGKSNPPAATVELIRLHALGEPADPAFAGCSFRNGKFWDDYGYGHTLGDLRLFPLYRSYSNQYFHTLKHYDLVRKKTPQDVDLNTLPAIFKLHSVA